MEFDLILSNFAPLHCACETGNLDIINLLLEYNQDPNLICNKRIPLTERGTIFWTPLHIACQSGNIETIKALIQYHVNVNQPNNRGVTALHIVAQHSMEDILNLLLENNADITATDADKETPLFLAIREKISYNVEKLVSDEIVNNYNAKKDTPLHVACTLGFTDIASILLDHNSHINIPDNAGNTPLHLAVLSKKKDCVELLLEHGADIFVLNKKRQSAFSLSSGDITTLLKKQIEQSKPGTETTRVKILDRTSTSATMKKSTTMQKESTRPTSKASSRQTSRAVSRTNTRPASRTASKSQQKSTDTKSVTSLKTATSKAGKTGKTQTLNRKQIKEQNDLERHERENYMDTWMDEIVQMIDNAAANFAEEMKIVQEEIDDFNRYMENTKQDQNQDEN